MKVRRHSTTAAALLGLVLCALVCTAVVQVVFLWLAYHVIYGWLAAFVIVLLLWLRVGEGRRVGRKPPLCYGGRRMATFLTVYVLACYPMFELLFGNVLHLLYFPVSDLFGTLVESG